MVKFMDFGFLNKFIFGYKLDMFCGLLVYFVFEVLFGDLYEVLVVGKCDYYFCYKDSLFFER